MTYSDGGHIRYFGLTRQLKQALGRLQRRTCQPGVFICHIYALLWYDIARHVQAQKAPGCLSWSAGLPVAGCLPCLLLGWRRLASRRWARLWATTCAPRFPAELRKGAHQGRCNTIQLPKQYRRLPAAGWHATAYGKCSTRTWWKK